MHASVLTTALLLGTAVPLLSQSRENCRHDAQKTATVAAAGARSLMLKVGAGSLKVEGRAGLDRVVIRGRACASSVGLLEDIQLRAERNGSEVHVESVMPDQGWTLTGERYASLDLVIEVPERMAADISDGSGFIDITNLGAVTITDGSGEITGTNLHGDVRVRDGSGGITLSDMAGAVSIHDGSGEIDLSNVGGQVEIVDGSGEIEVRGARNSVRVSDGSGSINVSDVAGNLTVERDGSGAIEYANVRGTVDIPRRRVRGRQAL